MRDGVVAAMVIWRRRLRRALMLAIGITAIALAVLVGVLQLALPWWASNPDRVARLIGGQLGTPVAIASTHPYWSVRGPLIELRGVRFGAEGEAGGLHIEQAAWAMDLSGLVRSDRPLHEFRIHGLDLTLARSDEGHWQLLGLPELMRGDARRPVAQVLHALPAVAIYDSHLHIDVFGDGPALPLHLRELRRFEQGGAARWRGRLANAAGSGGELLLSVDSSGREHARMHVAGTDLAVADWFGPTTPAGLQLVEGRLTVSVWVDFDDGGVSDAQLQWHQSASRWRAHDAPDAVDDPDVADAAATGETVVELPGLSTALRWHRQGDEARLLVHDIEFGELPSGRIVGHQVGEHLRLRGTDLYLTPLAAVLALSDRLPDRLRSWLVQAQPSGQIDWLQLDFDADGLRQAGLGLSDWRSEAVDKIPGITGLSLDLQGNRDGVVIRPAPGEITVDLPGMWVAPVSGHIDSGVVSGWPGERGWRLETDALAVSGVDYQGVVSGGIELLPGQKPWLDLGAVASGDLLAANQFWPIDKIPKTAEWLGRAMTGGRVVRGEVWIRGPVGPMPYPDHLGHLEAVVEVEGAGLDYHDDWPGIRNAKAQLVFENTRLTVTGERLDIAGLAVSGGGAEIPDMKTPVLRVRAEGRDSGEALMAALEHTPLHARFGEHLVGMSVTGQPRVALTLDVPLKRELGQLRVDGQVRFDGERFGDERRNLVLADLAGELRFDHAGAGAEDLAVTLAGEPARLDLRIGSHTQAEAMALEARLGGRLSVGALAHPLETLAPLAAASRGRADWRVDLAVPEAGAGRASVLRIDSDLRGVGFDLPAPLRKPAATALPLSVLANLDTDEQRVGAKLGNLVDLDLRLAHEDRPLRASIALGGAAPEPLPPHGVVISGQPASLDLSGWMAMAPRADGTAGWPRVQLRTGELEVFGRALREVDLRVEPDAGGARISLAGPDAHGGIRWPDAGSGQAVRVRLARLHVPAPEAGGAATIDRGFDPGTLPPLDIEIDDLRLGAIDLGRLEMQSLPGQRAYRIEQFRSRSPLLELDAHGDWWRSRGEERSQFVIELRADDLGEMLTAFGFASPIEGGPTEAWIDGGWIGAPAAFALEKIDGTLTVKVGSGRIREVDPGVGRLFGLFNLRELPRRLMLDFRDFFDTGMRFSSIEGSFRLNVGNAFTDDITLKSPSADIVATGRTGLAGRDYDQTLQVRPRVGGTLPVVGAIAGGPAGAAAGLVMQGLLRIDDSTRIVYRITGPWEAPVITKQDTSATEPDSGVGVDIKEISP